MGNKSGRASDEFDQVEKVSYARQPTGVTDDETIKKKKIKKEAKGDNEFERKRDSDDLKKKKRDSDDTKVRKKEKKKEKSESSDSDSARKPKKAENSSSSPKKSKSKSSSEKRVSSGEECDGPDLHPAAAALSKALNLKKASSDSGDNEKKPNPLALNLKNLGGNREDDGQHPFAAALASRRGDASPFKLKPVIGARDFSGVQLKTVSRAENDESGMDTVRAQAIADAKNCRVVASEVYPFLKVSGDWVARNKEVLHDAGVTHILNMAHTVCKNYHEDSGEFDYLALDVIDSANESIICFLLEACAYIEKARKARGCCYVHCHMGVSRSCTVVIAYAMVHKNMAFKDAFDMVKEIRPVASPNAGFIAQLMEWERQLKETPTHTQLYRIAPHSKIDPALVIKLCYEDDGKTPVRATPMELDARGLFMVHDYKNKKLLLWMGPRCSASDAYKTSAQKFSSWLLKLMPAFSKCELVDTKKDKKMVDFWAALGVDTRDAVHMDDSDVDQDLSKYDIEYAKIVKKPSNRPEKKLQHSRNSIERIKTESQKVELYGWKDLQENIDEEPSIQSQWERMKNYDVDDLQGGSMYILFVQGQSKSKYQSSFVWIGKLLEGKLNKDAALKLANGFIKYKSKSDLAAKVEDDEEESAEFWKAFESGY